MIEVNAKYGCLTVLDLGEEYKTTDKYLSYIEEIESLKKDIEYYNSIKDTEQKIKIIKESRSSFASELKTDPKCSNVDRKYKDFVKYHTDTNNRKCKEIDQKLETHYKCKCKCGQILYYNELTIESKPKYCFSPVSISTRCTYSVRANNATYRKRQKYEGNESVILLDKSECVPSNKYCENYNKDQAKKLAIKEQKLEAEIAAIPRIYAKNYDTDYTGKHYETLNILECCNEHLESDPKFSYNQQHQKSWNNITVYKQYRCTCELCGKEQLITCDRFGIYPPTEYGYHAYFGYWSEAYCDCHKISSFQWIVNKLLFENNINYRAEYSFSDLTGFSSSDPLRFDFAVFNDDNTLKCLIECQGEQHYKPVDEFGGRAQYKIQVENDELKREYAKKKNIPLIEISYKQKKFEKVEQILKNHNVI